MWFMIKSMSLRAMIGAAFLCGGFAFNVVGQTRPPVTIAPPSPPMRDAMPPSSEIERPSRTAAEVAAAPVAQKPRAMAHGVICGNPKVLCRTGEIIFHPYDLPFRAPRSAVIYDTELFYAVILKSLAAGDDNCDIFISEEERLAAQALFPDRKVFASRCTDPENLFYTNTKPNYRIMAVYAGKTLAEANRALAAVKASGRFAGANLRRMRTGFNGT
jgi:hypothetical protein